MYGLPHLSEIGSATPERSTDFLLRIRVAVLFRSLYYRTECRKLLGTFLTIQCECPIYETLSSLSTIHKSRLCETLANKALLSALWAGVFCRLCFPRG